MISLKEHLTQILINNKLLTQEQLNHALDEQKKKGGRLSEIIVGLGFIKENDLTLILSQGLGLPLMDIKRFKIDPEVIKIIPWDVARHYQIAPISKMGDTLTVAMADPLNVFAIDHIRSLTGYKINSIIANAKDILQALEQTYPDAAGGVIDGLLKEISTTSIELVKQEKEELPTTEELTRGINEVPVIKITDFILESAVRKRASDILIEQMEKALRIRFRIDGVLHEEKAPARFMHPLIVSRIKIMSELNIAEHRLPQEGRFKARIDSKEVDFRVSILPSSLGEKASLRILDKAQVTLDIEKLGFNEEVVTILKRASRYPHGMILSCGPTGSGKTTTLYSILKFVDTPEKNIVTVEDPVEYQLEGINQVSIRPEIGLTFASALRSILRQDPNIIMVGEIRDLETVDIAIKAALTGHLVLSTLHTNTAIGSIVRLANMDVEPYLLTASLICVIAQRLVRRICPECKEKYILKPEIIKKLKLILPDGADKTKCLTEGIELFRGKGCKHCFNMGYSGRAGIAEVMMLTPAVKELILSRAVESAIKEKTRAEGMRTLREVGLSFVYKGITTLEEVLRVTTSDE
jgi:type IV pilus assembly protein PilB